VFDYAAPFGFLGRLAERFFLTRYMRRFLAAHNRELKRIAESDSGASSLQKADRDQSRDKSVRRFE